MQLRIAEEGRLASKPWELESIDENADQMHTNSPAIVGSDPANYQCDATRGPHTPGDRPSSSQGLAGLRLEPRDSGPLARDRTQQ